MIFVAHRSHNSLVSSLVMHVRLNQLSYSHQLLTEDVMQILYFSADLIYLWTANMNARKDKFFVITISLFQYNNYNLIAKSLAI